MRSSSRPPPKPCSSSLTQGKCMSSTQGCRGPGSGKQCYCRYCDSNDYTIDPCWKLYGNPAWDNHEFVSSEGAFSHPLVIENQSIPSTQGFCAWGRGLGRRKPCYCHYCDNDDYEIETYWELHDKLTNQEDVCFEGAFSHYPLIDNLSVPSDNTFQPYSSPNKTDTLSCEELSALLKKAQELSNNDVATLKRSANHVPAFIHTEKDNITHSSPKRVHAGGCSRKKLLILDLNGLLADVVSKRTIVKRPFCSDFLEFCFERFDVAVWSSKTRKNVDSAVNYLMGDMKHKLLFCWDLSHCTETGFTTLENKYKTIVFKELRKIWENEDPNLPWQKGDYNESNTLLLDDSPYKALLNPPHTAIFPYSFKFHEKRNDNLLDSGGDLRVYLEEVAAAENIQKYVEKHPFGQRAITQTSSSWRFYFKVINSLRSLSNTNVVGSVHSLQTTR